MKKAIMILVAIGLLSTAYWLGYKNGLQKKTNSNANVEACDPDGELIVVDGNLVNNDWLQANEPYICTQSLSSNKCSKQIVVNLTLMPSLEFRVNWLKTNCKFICFDDSCEQLKNGHEVSQLFFELIKPFIKRNTTLTWNALNEQLVNKHGYTLLGDTDSKDDYDYWIGFSIDDTNQLNTTMPTSFDEDGLNFSIPFLKCLYKNAGTQGQNAKVSFYHLKLPLIRDVMFVSAEGNTAQSGALVFYDYTTRPQIILDILSKILELKKAK